MVEISAAVEGYVDEAVISRLIVEVGAIPGPVYGKKGKGLLRDRINGYNNAANFAPWVVLVDLDHDAACAPELRDLWIRHIAPGLCFRVAVREVETWLLADRKRIASFLSVPISRIPRDPEGEDNPKQTLVNLAARSRRSQIRDDMTPRAGSSRNIGPAYTSRLIEFVNTRATGWRPDTAVGFSNSLQRAIECLRSLVIRYS